MALLIIDVQNDFCHEDGVLSKAGKDLSRIQDAVKRIEGLVFAARQFGLSSIFIRTAHDEWTNSRPYVEINRAKNKPPICFPGTWGAEFYRVKPREEEYVITKHRYSAFSGTNLEMVLRCRGIDTILFSGIMTNVCVESSLREAFSKDFVTILVEDCVGTDRKDLHEATVENVREFFGVVTSAEVLIKDWSQNGDGILIKKASY
jgi:ureidoacrylate peracid hydrolase